MKNFFRSIIIFLVWIYLKACYRHKTYGKEHITQDGGVMASNHSSYLDPQIIGVSCPQEVHFLARSSLFTYPIFGWLIRVLNTHPVAAGKGNISTFKKAYELLASGKKVVIFPEGSRAPDGALREAKLGVGVLVLRAKCQVIPVYIHGTYEVWNSRHKFPKLWGKTACVFGSALDFSDLFEASNKKEAQAKIAAHIMLAIENLKKWYLEGAKGSPP